MGKKWKNGAVAAAIAVVAFEIFMIFILAQPTINSVGDAPDPVEVPGYNNITANITNATHVYVEIYYPTGNLMGNFSMTRIGNAYVYGSFIWYFNTTYSYPMRLGQYKYYIKARNWTGWMTIGPYTITVQDTTPPSSNVNSISYWNNDATLLNITASDNYAIANISLYYRFSVDNSSWSNWTFYGKDDNGTDGWNFLFTFPDGEGYYEFYSIANDTAGNTEASPATADAKAAYDITLPQTTYSLQPSSPNGKNGWYITPVNISFASTDTISGIAYTKYRIDKEIWQIYTKPFIISSDGSHSLEFYSVDKAGNAEEIKNITIEIDTTKPEIVLQRPLMGYLYLFDRKIWPLASGNTIIIGKITVRVIAFDSDSGINNVSFYVNDVLQSVDMVSPYEWIWRGDMGWKYLYAVACNKAGLKEDTFPLHVFIFSL